MKENFIPLRHLNCKAWLTHAKIKRKQSNLFLSSKFQAHPYKPGF